MPADKPYPPFVTNQSPSNARGRAEYTHPTPSGDAQVVAIYARLSEAEENARSVCATVADLLADRARAEQVLDEAAEHQSHRDALGELIHALGGSAPRAEECRKILLHGPESVARGSSDLESLAVLALTRAELRAEYDQASTSAELDDGSRVALARLATPSR